MEPKVVIFFVHVFCVLINLGCSGKISEKWADKHIVPYTPVYTQIDLRIGGESQLQVPGQPIYLKNSQPDGTPLGYNGHGIIVIRLNDTEFSCWDATCTSCQDLTSYMTSRDLSGEIATCPVCGKEFSLRYGSALNATEKIYPLKSYPILKQGNRLIVRY